MLNNKTLHYTSVRLILTCTSFSEIELSADDEDDDDDDIEEKKENEKRTWDASASSTN